MQAHFSNWKTHAPPGSNKGGGGAGVGVAVYYTRQNDALKRG